MPKIVLSSVFLACMCWVGGCSAHKRVILEGELGPSISELQEKYAMPEWLKWAEEDIDDSHTTNATSVEDELGEVPKRS